MKPAPKPVATRRIAFCADDVGLLEGTADTVIGLADAGRLSSASCIVNAPAWPTEAKALVASKKTLHQFGLGLHFNLTEGTPLSPDLARVWPRLPGLKELMVRAHLGALPRDAMKIEWRAQRDAFSDTIGHSPSHVDGHQHVHQLPHIRDIVVDAEAATAATQRFAIRSTGRVLGPGHGFKRMVIEGTGGRVLMRMLRGRRIRHNAALLGVYDFQEPDYRRLVRGWLASAPADGGLVFCHPLAAAPAADGADAIMAARRREADYLGSPAFAEDLATAGFKVAAAWQSSSAG